MIIKYIWHDRHSAYAWAWKKLKLCSAPSLFTRSLWLLFSSFFFWAAASEHFMKRVGKRFTKIVNFSFIWVFCALFLEFSRYRSWHMKSFIRFNAKFSAGKVGAWNQRMGKSIDNFICVCDVHEFCIRRWCLWLVFLFYSIRRFFVFFHCFFSLFLFVRVFFFWYHFHKK